jgi:hypothetical protein
MIRPRRWFRGWWAPGSLAVPLALAVAVAHAGCLGGKTPVGMLCDLGVDISGDVPPTVVLVNPIAPECPSGICLLPSKERGTNTAPLCTALCESDGDCSDHELRDRNDPNDRRCRDGFSCRRVLPGLETNPLACKRVCVCRDFVRTGDTTTGSAQGCAD